MTKSRSAMAVAPLSALALLAAGGPAAAVTTGGTANATITSPIAVSADQDLYFGRILQPLSGGQINVQPNGTVAPIVNLTLADPSEPQPGTFLVTGTPGSIFTIALPISLNLSRIGGGAPDMSVSFITSLPTPTGTLDGAGERIVAVGGNLAVNAGQAVGLYEGTYSITVEYQ